MANRPANMQAASTACYKRFGLHGTAQGRCANGSRNAPRRPYGPAVCRYDGV